MKKRFGKIGLIFTLTFILVALAVTIAVVAANYTQNEITWEFTFNSTDKTATITKVSLSRQTKEFNIPSTVTDAATGEEYTVTAIGNNAFNQKNVFGKLTIPDTVTSIGSGAFANSYIYGTVVIPESVTYIGSSAFENCDGIVEVVLPSGVTVIESNTFKNCFALSKVNTENIITFKGSAFYDCQALHEITIGPSTKSIEGSAFYNCDALDGKIDLSSVTSLSGSAFENCSRIDSFVIPDCTDSSGSSIKISGVFDAFKNCPEISGYYATANNTNYSSDDNGVLYSKDGATLLYYPKARTDVEFTVSANVTTISKGAFNGTLYLETIKFEEKQADITLQDEAFAGSSIVNAYIPDNIKTVPSNLFKDCKNLEWVVFGSGVELIGLGSFQSCSALKTVIIKNDMANAVSVPTGASLYYASEYNCSSHIYGYDDKAPSCTEYGYNKCIICDRYAYIKQTNHSGAILEEVKVSCTTDGYRVVDCFTCGIVEVATDKTPGHISNGKVYSVSAGYKSPEFKYTTCTVCNQMYVCEYNANFYTVGDVNCDGKVDFFDLSAIKNYVNDNSSVSEISTTNADIVRDGKVDAKDVAYLSDYLTGQIDELPTSNITCSNHGRKSTLEIIKPSCDENGFRIRYCVNCGKLEEEINAEKTQHTLSDSTVISPSCTLNGQKISTCTTCNKKVYEVLEKTDHSGNWYTLAGQRGFEYRDCSVCGAIDSRVVDYTTFDTLILQIPKYYTAIFQPETVNLIEPILKNYELSLTQAEVNDNISILSDALANAQYKVYDVPVVFINAPTFSTSYGEADIIVAYMGEDGKTKIEAIEYNGEVKIRGRTSASHSKTPYNFKFSSKIDLFDMGASKKYCLLSNQNDATLLKNALTFELSDLLGIENSCKYTIVDLYTNGKYRGCYMLTTAVDVGEDRVDIDEETDFLLEIEHSPIADDTKKSYLVNSPIFGIQFLVNSPEIEDMTAEGLSKMRSSVALIDFAIKSGDWETIQQYVDVDSVAKYFILHDMLKEIDIVWDSTRFYIKNGKLYGGPAWDFDLSMNTTGGGSTDENNAYWNRNGNVCEGGIAGDSTTGVWASLGWKSDRNRSIWFKELYTYSPDFVKLVCEYVEEFNTELSLLYEDEVDENGKVIRVNIIDSIVEDDDISGSLKRNRDNKIPGYVDKMTYDEKVESLREWLKKRNEWMQGFYADKLEKMN